MALMIRVGPNLVTVENISSGRHTQILRKNGHVTPASYPTGLKWDGNAEGAMAFTAVTVKSMTAFAKLRSTRVCCLGSLVNMCIIAIREKISYSSQEKLISQRQYTVTQTLEPLWVNCRSESHRQNN
jgi:hypothetical protein